MQRAADDLVEVDERAVNPHRASQAGVVKLAGALGGSWRADQTDDTCPSVVTTSKWKLASSAAAHSCPTAITYSEYRSSIRHHLVPAERAWRPASDTTRISGPPLRYPGSRHQNRSVTSSPGRRKCRHAQKLRSSCVVGASGATRGVRATRTKRRSASSCPGDLIGLRRAGLRTRPRSS
jgi:hypothetical protein